MIGEKIERIMIRCELTENDLINMLLAGADHMAGIALNDLRDHETARHFLEVFKIIDEVNHE